MREIDVAVNLNVSSCSPSTSPPILIQSQPVELMKSVSLSESTYSLTSTTTLIPRNQDGGTGLGGGGGSGMNQPFTDVQYWASEISPNFNDPDMEKLVSVVNKSALNLDQSVSQDYQHNPIQNNFISDYTNPNEEIKSNKPVDFTILIEAIKELRSLIMFK